MNTTVNTDNFQGAFTPVCSARHVPEYVEKLPELKAKGVDVVAVLAYNDAFVMSAWGKANGVKNDDILFLSDPDAKFSKSIGWTEAGGRTGRYGVILDHGKVTYAAREREMNTLEVGIWTIRGTEYEANISVI